MLAAPYLHADVLPNVMQSLDLYVRYFEFNAGPYYALKGLFGKPTVVNNVLSFAAIPLILEKGGAFYKGFGTGRSRGTQTKAGTCCPTPSSPTT